MPVFLHHTVYNDAEVAREKGWYKRDATMDLCLDHAIETIEAILPEAWAEINHVINSTANTLTVSWGEPRPGENAEVYYFARETPIGNTDWDAFKERYEQLVAERY